MKNPKYEYLKKKMSQFDERTSNWSVKTKLLLGLPLFTIGLSSLIIILITLYTTTMDFYNEFKDVIMPIGTLGLVLIISSKYKPKTDTRKQKVENNKSE